MALGYLYISFIVMFLVSILGIVSLYLVKNQNLKNILFYALFIWSLCISFINITALPSNYILQKIFGVLIGILALVSIFIKLKLPNKANTAHLLMVLCIIFGIIDIIL